MNPLAARQKPRTATSAPAPDGRDVRDWVCTGLGFTAVPIVAGQFELLPERWGTLVLLLVPGMVHAWLVLDGRRSLRLVALWLNVPVLAVTLLHYLFACVSL